MILKGQSGPYDSLSARVIVETMTDVTPSDESRGDSVGDVPHGIVGGSVSASVPLAYRTSTLSTAPYLATSAVNEAQRFPVQSWATSC